MEKQLSSRIESIKLNGNRTRAEVENNQEKKWFIRYKKKCVFYFSPSPDICV